MSVVQRVRTERLTTGGAGYPGSLRVGKWSDHIESTTAMNARSSC